MTRPSVPPDSEQIPLMPEARELEAYVFSYAVTPATNQRAIILSRRLIRLSFTLVLIDILTFLFYTKFSTNMDISTLGGLTASLLLPACGYCGVKTKDRYYLCCFWSWSLVFFIFHLLTALLFISWISNGFSWVLFIPVTSNIVGAVFLWLSFSWGKQLHESGHNLPWEGDEVENNDEVDDSRVVDALAALPGEGTIIGDVENGLSDVACPSSCFSGSSEEIGVTEGEDLSDLSDSEGQLSQVRRHWGIESDVS